MHNTLHVHHQWLKPSALAVDLTRLSPKPWARALHRLSGSLAVLALAGTCLLSACGGGGSAASTPNNTTPPVASGTTPTSVVTTPTLTLSVSGTAATGAPIGSATVSALCASGSGSASTNAKGEFTVTLAGTATLPCLLELKKAPLVLHGIALQTGTANITPLTELQFALLAGSANRSAVFAAFASTANSTTATSAQASQYSASAVAVAWVKVKAKLLTLGLDGTATATLNAMDNPNTVPFSATSGDASDYVLEQVAVRLTAKGLTLDTLVGQLLNQIPLGSFSASAVGLTVTTNAAASSDPDGSVSAYVWKWGDGSADQTTTSPTATHAYAGSGTFSINLVVLDALGGASSAVSQNITVLIPPANSAPVANAAIASANGLLAAFDASASSDTDGAIVGYAWNFGEPSSASNTATGVTSTHAYARAGSYTATLTLTDNQGSVTSKTSALTVSPPAAVATGKLNDTSARWCFSFVDGNVSLTSCDSTDAKALSQHQDGMLGRDAVTATNTAIDGTLGFSYTKIGMSGQTLPNSDAVWSCIKDNVTGLMWEVKTSDGGSRDVSKTYFYSDLSGGSAPNTEQPMAADTRVTVNMFRNSVNEAGLCGATDWRLPTVRELQSLVKYSEEVINQTWLRHTFAGKYWSSSVYLPSIANYEPTQYVWHIDFDSGLIDYSVADTGLSVRLVRSTP